MSDQVQNKMSKFAHHWNDSNWETLVHHKKMACICSLFKVYTGEWACKAIRDGLQRPCHLSRAESKGQILENIPLQIGSYSSATNYLQRLQELCPVSQVILGKGLGKL
jgi:hypothetical protein